MSEWISVDESLPNEGEYVAFASFYKSLGGLMEMESVVAGEFYNGRFHVDVSGIEASNYDGGAHTSVDMKPTHWAPLPEPPKCKQ